MANQDMSAAKQALDLLSADPATRRLAENRIVWDWAYRTDMAHEREEGRQDGLRDAVRAACGAFGIDLTDDRTKGLEAATQAELDALLAALLRDHSWPG